MSLGTASAELTRRRSLAMDAHTESGSHTLSPSSGRTLNDASESLSAPLPRPRTVRLARHCRV